MQKMIRFIEPQTTLLVTLLTCVQIAAIEAVPIQEFGNNPSAVLCTTSRGGHLGWFENGGGRWFLRPVRAFLSLRGRPY